MAKKQAVVRCDPILLAECSELLERQIGKKLPQATVATVALVALKNQHTHELISQKDATARRVKYAADACVHTLGLLQSAGLIQDGYYEVVVDPERGLYLEKDGELVRPVKPDTEDDSNVPPDWVAEFLPAKKQAVN